MKHNTSRTGMAHTATIAILAITAAWALMALPEDGSSLWLAELIASKALFLTLTYAIFELLDKWSEANN